MKILDLFCGRGGWSKPFVEDGHEVIGIDFEDFTSVYPGKFIKKDIRKVNGNDFKGFDLIIGSPPCKEFSQQTSSREGRYGIKKDIKKGLELIYEFERIVREAQPRFWAFENVRLITRYYKKNKPIWNFKISKRGHRVLFGNFSIPLAKEFISKRNMEYDYIKFSYKKRSQLRAEIPYPIAKFIFEIISKN